MIDVDALLASVDAVKVIGTYTPLIKRGNEWVGKCLAHSPDNHPSMTVYQRGGKWIAHCFACDFHADVIGCVMEAEGCDFTTACEKLGATDWKPALQARAYPPAPERITSVPPLGEPRPDMVLKELGRPVKVWEYHAADGSLLGYVVRYEGEGGKEFRCWTWGSRGSQPARWGVGHWSKPRPLYGLHRLAARPKDPVLIVEGEKAADAAAKLLPSYVAVTWPGGAQAWKHADWEPLRGRQVLLWPDADEAGQKAMRQVGILLASSLDCRVRLIDTTGQPDGWDAFDCTMTTAEFIAWAKPRASDVTHGSPDEPPAIEIVKKPDTAPDVHTGAESGDLPPLPDDLPPEHAAEPAPPRKRGRPRLRVVGGDTSLPDPDDEPLPAEFSESGIADEFVAAQQAEFRYVPEWRDGGWLVWTGARWKREANRSTAMERLRALVHGLKFRPSAASLQQSSKNKFESRQFCGNVLSFAQTDKRILATVAQWDGDPFLLGTPAGVVDLRTGDMIEARPEQYITRSTAVAPAPGETPLFDRVIGQAADGDADMLDYLWRWLGYILTGDVREESFLFLYGPPACGKTTLIEAIAGILGNVDDGGYAAACDMDLFTETRLDRGSDRLICLYGARFAYASETEEGRHWKPALVKLVTGGDTVRGRRLYENSTAFRPTHKLLVYGNHRPHMRQADEGLRRRLQIVEYHSAVDEADRDLTLKQRLVAEYPAILWRMIQGCMEWQRMGLRPPEAIRANVEAYYDAEDSFGAWVEERIEKSATHRLQSSEAYQSYRAWVEERGERAPSHKRFTTLMHSRGYETRKSGTRYFEGLRLRSVVLPPVSDEF